MILHDDSTHFQSAKEKKNRREEGSKFEINLMSYFTRFFGIKMENEENGMFLLWNRGCQVISKAFLFVKSLEPP